MIGTVEAIAKRMGYQILHLEPFIFFRPTRLKNIEIVWVSLFSLLCYMTTNKVFLKFHENLGSLKVNKLPHQCTEIFHFQLRSSFSSQLYIAIRIRPAETCAPDIKAPQDKAPTRYMHRGCVICSALAIQGGKRDRCVRRATK
jgi:hypothetical protein